MKVDVAMVRGMAARYRDVTGDIADLDTTTATQGLPAALPETDTGKFAEPIGKRVDAAFDATGNRLRAMAEACESAARNYETTDEASAERLTAEGVL